MADERGAVDNTASTCRSCSAPIEWAVTDKKMRRIPLDPLPDGLDRSPNANLAAVGRKVPTGEVLVSAVGKDHPQATRISHFATCPNAKRHRKR